VLKGLIDVSLKILAVRYEFCMTVFTASRHPRLALEAAQGARREGGGATQYVTSHSAICASQEGCDRMGM